MKAQEHDVETDHDYDGIREFDNPLPRWWLWTFAITVLFSIGYWLVKHNLKSEGSFAVFADEMEAVQRAAAAAEVDEKALVLASKDPVIVSEGKAVFESNCATCHGQKGEGLTGPNLTDNYWIHGGMPKDLVVTIAAGYTKLGMPAWGLNLGRERINRVIAYLLSIRNTNVPGRPPQGDEFTGTLPQ
jgi:cytochrome c oxidase cbb3-type subunit 3